MNGFDEFFNRLTRYSRHDWQARLARDSTCRDRLIRIPTGFGKTAGATTAWLWHRVHQRNDEWPRRLVLCLPMRTLVEQTERAVVEWIDRAGLTPKPAVHVLLGGLSLSDWHLEPEQDAILIGTQDMLLSRALNRGYGSGRARWPMEYGLLNVDCLWVMDEIQLMDVGLATSAQLQGFANTDEHNQKMPRPRRTWWMSATLQRDWLRRAPALGGVDSLPIVDLDPSEQAGPLWTVERTVRFARLPVADDGKAQAWAGIVAEAHKAARKGMTLVVANTVKSARALHAALEQLKKAGDLGDLDLRIVHSRFRGEERRHWAKEFLAREHCATGRNRIIVATQVVEAGVDISADALVTELAPWASLIQRFGRCARYGGNGQIVVVDRRHSDESARQIAAKDDADRTKKREDADRATALPYGLLELQAAAEAIALLNGSAGPGALESFEKTQEAKPENGLLPRLYPYAPLHVLTRRELHDLFDTGPDLTGADVDVSRFVREGDERDVTAWWFPVLEGELPHQRLRPAHDALCRVPLGDARKWLFPGGGNSDGDRDSAAEDSSSGSKTVRPRAWVWSYVDRQWDRLEKRHVYPGQTILVAADAGGYDVNEGFTGATKQKPLVVREHARAPTAVDVADEADEQDELSENDRQYKTIATHNHEVAAKARELAGVLSRDDVAKKVLPLSGLVHDIGKAHPGFAGAIRDRNGIPSGTPLAKAPKGRWHGIQRMYDHSPLGKRPGFRHELASALALFELAWRARPTHPALLGGREEILAATVGQILPEGVDQIYEPRGMLADLIALDETAFNLVVYLVMTHHGKVRATLPMSAHDQDNAGQDGNLPLRGVRDGDTIPALALVDLGLQDFDLPEVALHLDPARLGLSKRYGPSWAERVLVLRQRYGEFQLAWLEALLRVADVRASQITQPPDSRLPQELVQVQATADGSDRGAGLREWIERTLAAAVAEPATQQGGKKTSKRTRAAKRNQQSGPGGAA